PHSLPCSTIGAEGLNFRVRDGTGCFPLAKAAETLNPATRFGLGKFSVPMSRTRDSIVAVPRSRWCRLFFGNRTGTRTSLLFAHLGCCEQVARPISTGQLHTLRCFHFRPINPVFCWGPYPPY